MAQVVRTKIPPSGANARVLEHSSYDFRALAQTTGNIWFVDSNAASGGNGKSPEGAVTTTDAAINLCSAGDTILVMEGHAETLAAAAAVAQDVAGVKIIGLGVGARRPTYSFSATDSTWTIAGASTLVKNIRVKSTVNELVKFFSVTGANVTLDAVDVVDGGSAKEAIQFCLTTADADDLCIQNCYHVQATAAASTMRWIYLVGTTGARILNNTFILKLADNATDAVVSADGDTRLTEIRGNRMHVTGYTAGLVSVVIGASGATGIHTDGRYYCDTTITTTINDCPSMASFEVYCSNDLDKNGILDPVVGS